MIKRVDALEVNFVDSAARREFKMSSTRGMGESRIYVGSDENLCDAFFDLNNIEYFFSKKEDLIQYLKDAKDEFMNPSQDYRANITDMYDDLKQEVRSINGTLKYSFRKTWDNQNRYFLVLIDNDSRKMYDFVKDICLPRITKYSFIKFVDDTTGKYYIYLKPQFFNNIDIDSDPFAVQQNENAEQINITVRRTRQAEYRKKLLIEMPACPFTHVSDDRLLVACHIKPFKDCDTDDERYDFHNGITMTPTYHVLFDQGLISFENNGKLLVSPFLNNRTQELLNIKQGDEKRLQSNSAQYLKYHRENVFCQLPSNFIIEDSNDGIGYNVRYEENDYSYNFNQAPTFAIADSADIENTYGKDGNNKDK